MRENNRATRFVFTKATQLSFQTTASKGAGCFTQATLGNYITRASDWAGLAAARGKFELGLWIVGGLRGVCPRRRERLALPGELNRLGLPSRRFLPQPRCLGRHAPPPEEQGEIEKAESEQACGRRIAKPEGMQLRTLLPAPSLIQLDYLVASDALITLVARTSQTEATCPGCGRTASRIQSRYTRTLADLPRHGTPDRLQLRLRRFFCDQPDCTTAIFTERLPALVGHYSRPTCRQAKTLDQIGYALGG
jgi:hypothetical protein